MLLGQHCSWLSTILNNIVEPELTHDQVLQCRTILLTTLNNVAPATLFNIVDNIEQCCPSNIVISCFQQLLIFGRVVFTDLMQFDEVNRLDLT